MNNQTIEKLTQMRLHGMAQLHAQRLKERPYEELTADEYLALLTDHEWEHRQNAKTDRLLKQAGFRQRASISDVKHDSSRNLDRNMFNRLSAMDFLDRKENILLTGASGVGKSYLAQALGHQACLLGHKVHYAITSRLFGRLKLAKLDGTYLREMKKLNSFSLLILDDFGLQQFNQSARESLLDIIDDRHCRVSTIVASQIPVSEWYHLIGENTIADAILDRIVNSSHRIDLKGESRRKNFMNSHE
ncbi:MAG: IS21-like element helper ATPase IstB [Cytophagales bacterium]|nr:IS21-like element helper ATPase IstB [Cytophagales bacterium]